MGKSRARAGWPRSLRRSTRVRRERPAAGPRRPLLAAEAAELLRPSRDGTSAGPCSAPRPTRRGAQLGGDVAARAGRPVEAQRGGGVLAPAARQGGQGRGGQGHQRQPRVVRLRAGAAVGVRRGGAAHPARGRLPVRTPAPAHRLSDFALCRPPPRPPPLTRAPSSGGDCRNFAETSQSCLFAGGGIVLPGSPRGRAGEL